MSADYMPTTEEILRYFDAPRYKVDPKGVDEDFATYLGRVSIETMHSRIASEAAALRWLNWHDRQLAAKAWDEGYDEARQTPDGGDGFELHGRPDNPYRALSASAERSEKPDITP